MNELNYKELSVLIVDDHASIRHALTRVAQGMGFDNIYNAVSGEAALTTLEKNQVHLVLLDLYMPGKDGFDVLMHIRNREFRSDIPVIIVTGEGDKEEIVKAVDLGASEYIVKPFHTEDIEKKTEVALTKYFDPSEESKLIRSAEDLVLEDQSEEALKQVMTALALKPESASIRHFLGSIYYKMEKIPEAREVLESNVEDNPSFYKSYSLLARIYFKLGLRDDGIEALSSELELNPKQPAKQTSLGKLKMKVKDFEGAKHHFREALKELPKLETALIAMGKLFFKEDNLDKSIYYFKRARRHHPQNSTSFEHLVKNCIEAKCPEKAEAILRDEKKAFPDRYDTYILLAKLYGSTNKAEKGIQVINDLLKRVPEHLEGMKILAALYMKNAETQNALVTYRKIFNIKPSIEVALQIADACSRGADLGEAIESLTIAAKMNGKDGRVFFKLGELFMSTKQYSKAFYAYRKARKCGLKSEVVDQLVTESSQLMHRRRMQFQAQRPRQNKKSA